MANKSFDLFHSRKSTGVTNEINDGFLAAEVLESWYCALWLSLTLSWLTGIPEYNRMSLVTFVLFVLCMPMFVLSE